MLQILTIIENIMYLFVPSVYDCFSQFFMLMHRVFFTLAKLNLTTVVVPQIRYANFQRKTTFK